MDAPSISLLTVCGLEELEQHGSRGVTHVLSILDPTWPDPTAFGGWDRHHRITLRFHDAIKAAPGVSLPEPEHVRTILTFIDDLRDEARGAGEGHVLIHCHAGISRSTAAMTMLLAKTYPDEADEALIERLVAIRPQSWPNSRMIAFADDILGRGGRLTEAVRRLHARQLEAKPHLAQIMRDLGRGGEIEAAQAQAA